MYSQNENRGAVKGMSVQLLNCCLFVLLRVSGVVSKYRTLLVPGILKIFYNDSSSVHSFMHAVISKWPNGSSKKVYIESDPELKAIALLELIHDLLMQCDLLTEPMCCEDVSRLFSLLCKLVNGDQAEVSLQALQIFDTDVILMNYIVHENQRLRMIEECLNKNRTCIIPILVK